MTTSAPPRPPRTRRGPGEPRHLILPAGIVSSSWPSVRDTCRGIGIEYDDWQAGFNRALLAKDGQGFYAADTAVMSICRQSGKTFDVGGVVFADSIISPGTTTVWTAHRFKVSRESFNEMRAWARRPELAAHIEYDEITTAAGNECIPFRNGSRILFAARERGAIRGFTKVRRLILDEAQILTESAMSDLVPTTNQAENPQIILMGTPPKPSDPSEVFTTLRTAALAGEIDGVLYIEYSAEEDCDLEDWDAVAEANPSYPKRTSKRDILRLRKLLTNDDDYRREGLGIWAERLTAPQVIPAEAWSQACKPRAERGDRVAYAIDSSPDGASASIAASDGLTSAVVEHGPGTAWVPAKMAALLVQRPGPVFLDPRSPAGALLVDLTEAKVVTVDVTPQQHAQACGGLLAAIIDDKFQHTGQAHLDAAVRGATRRPYGDAWAWNRRSSSVDISPLVAVTLARWGALQQSNIYEGPMVAVT